MSKLKEITETRCKLLAHAWLSIIDESGSEYEDFSTDKTNISYQRILACQIGLYSWLQHCIGKEQSFEMPENLASYLDSEQVIKEFTRHPSVHFKKHYIYLDYLKANSLKDEDDKDEEKINFF